MAVGSVHIANSIQKALDGPEISEEEHEVVLHGEVPVVGKEALPKERVSLQEGTLTDEQQVSEEVRKEPIERRATIAKRFRRAAWLWTGGGKPLARGGTQ